MNAQVIVFDMDGVLVDVSRSYREAIRQTVRHFTGQLVPPETVQDYKNQGGWNNDWALSHRLIHDLGGDAGYQEVVEKFQELFFTGGQEGLILEERWIAQPGLLERLSETHRLSVFTGRPRAEAEFTLNRFAPGLEFAPLLADEDVADHKPHPEGLLKIRASLPGNGLCYVGDTVDDARCARAAGVPFIGIVSQDSPRHVVLRQLLELEEAVAILDDINQLESVFAK
jgi:HAD superfamily phosphatase